jgi:protein O-mannosyl-transferase
VASVGLRSEVGTQSSNSFFFTDSRARTILLGVFILTIAVGIYAPVHNHPFFNLDDYLDVVDNVHIHHGLAWQTVRWSFVTTNMANWIPLSWLSHALDYQMFGANPAGHHDMNVFFHAVDALLLFWVLKRATGYAGRSFMVAALFAVHPMNVEAVAWIAERRSVLCTLFFVLALGTYQWYARNPTDKRYSAVALLFLLGLLAKPQVITLPFVLLLWDYWPLQRMFPNAPSSSPPLEVYPQQTLRQLITEKIPLLYLCIVDAVFTVYAQASVRPGLMPPLPARLKNAVFSYWLYIKKFFWPAGMAPELPHLGAWLTVWQVLAALSLLLAITALVLMARRYRYLPVGWFWFLGMLVPMIGILQAGRQGMADRFGYQPYIGLFVLVCWGVSDWAAKRHISIAWLAGTSTMVLLALAMVTHRQIGYWADNLTLWQHGVATVPNHWVADVNVGLQLVQRGKLSEAMPYFYRASAMAPDEGFSNMYIGYQEQKQGHLTAAISRYQHALRDFNLSLEHQAQIYRNMAVAYRDLGDLAKANECYAKALSLQSEEQKSEP